MTLYGFCNLTAAGRLETQLAERDLAAEVGWLVILLSSKLFLSAFSSLNLRACPLARILLDASRAVCCTTPGLLHKS